MCTKLLVYGTSYLQGNECSHKMEVTYVQNMNDLSVKYVHMMIIEHLWILEQKCGQFVNKCELDHHSRTDAKI